MFLNHRTHYSPPPHTGTHTSYSCSSAAAHPAPASPSALNAASSRTRSSTPSTATNPPRIGTGTPAAKPDATASPPIDSSTRKSS